MFWLTGSTFYSAVTIDPPFHPFIHSTYGKATIHAYSCAIMSLDCWDEVEKHTDILQLEPFSPLCNCITVYSTYFTKMGFFCAVYFSLHFIEKLLMYNLDLH